MKDNSDFVQIIQENHGIIFKISKAYCRDNEDQKDLYQDIVYQIWKSITSFRNESRISTWIYRIALNTSIAHLNGYKKKGNNVQLDFSLLNIADERDHLMEERINILYSHIKKLNVVEKAIILLSLEGKTYEEISAITGFTPSNVGTRLSRIKEKLRTQVKH